MKPEKTYTSDQFIFIFCINYHEIGWASSPDHTLIFLASTFYPFRIVFGDRPVGIDRLIIFYVLIELII